MRPRFGSHPRSTLRWLPPPVPPPPPVPAMALSPLGIGVGALLLAALLPGIGRCRTGACVHKSAAGVSSEGTQMPHVSAMALPPPLGNRVGVSLWRRCAWTPHTAKAIPALDKTSELVVENTQSTLPPLTTGIGALLAPVRLESRGQIWRMNSDCRVH